MTVKITINGDGLNFEGETNLHKAAQVIAFLGTEQADAPSGYGKQDGARLLGMTPSSGRTPRQIISQSLAKTNPQKIAAIGLYFKERGQDVFTRSEIAEQFRRAGEQIPKNVGRDLKEAVRLGLICESEGQRDEYYLTSDAETEIAETFSSSSNTSGAPKTRSTKLKVRKSTASTQEPTNKSLKDMNFTPIVDGLPNYWKTKKGDRVLWILKVGKNNGMANLDNKDIEYVGKKLDDHIPSSNVNSLSEVNRKRGYLSRNGTVYTLLGPGINYLEGLNKQSSDENES
ncbi:MAG: hypothetical protein V4437_00455 [Patescibacteria group bacterium]